jgi:ATP:ADP antiporter, AAA family
VDLFSIQSSVQSNVIDRFGWAWGALATPIAMLILSAPFFGFILFTDTTEYNLPLIVWFGAFQSLMSKASKNALFDPTTQMAYIPLDEVRRIDIIFLCFS